MKTGFYLTVLAAAVAPAVSAQTWTDLDAGANNWVTSLAEDDVNNVIYAGGHFTTIGGATCSKIAKWDGTAWMALGSGVDYGVHALKMIDGELYVGGEFLNAGGIPAARIAKYDGTTWSSMGSGIGGSVNDIADYNGDIYAGHLDWNLSACPGIKRWNGTAWTELGVGVNGVNANVMALQEYNGELYVGGDFETAGGITCNGIAKWNGTAWSAVGTGLTNTISGVPIVNALVVLNGELYVGGNFTAAGGVPANSLAKWNGTTWSAVGGGVNGGIGGLDPAVYDLEVINGLLFISGNFTNAGAANANYVAMHNGSNFTGLATGTNNLVYALGSYNNNLVAGGQFSLADGLTVNNIAEWSIAADAGIDTYPDAYAISLYPNPSSGPTMLRSERFLANATLTFFNPSGQVVHRMNNLNGQEIILDRGDLPPGIYYLQLSENDHFIAREKFVICK
jgi:trimeric autotransporter adhesin